MTDGPPDPGVVGVALFTEFRVVTGWLDPVPDSSAVIAVASSVDAEVPGVCNNSMHTFIRSFNSCQISGNTSPQPIHLFSKNNSSQTSSVEETANIMGETFHRNSSSISHSDKFKKFKIHTEKKPLHFSSDNSETYNLPILNARINLFSGSCS